MNIQEILSGENQNEVIKKLQEKSISLPEWEDLRKEYEVTQHPIYDRLLYPDSEEGSKIIQVSRIGFPFQYLVTNRMSGLLFGIPVKRHYELDSKNDIQNSIKNAIERIFSSIRIDTENFERSDLYNKSCEFATIWSTKLENHGVYGFESPVKFRIRHVSPALGDKLYPLFDENDDLIAFSVLYERILGGAVIQFFDCYTDAEHLRWTKSGDNWGDPVKTPHTLGKIPVIYLSRPKPIWGSISPNVYEVEWLLSREGNYSRKNSKPLLVVKANEGINYGDEKPGTTEFRTIIQVPEGGDLEYKIWASAIDSNKFLKDSIKEINDEVLQIPNFSFENMKSKPLSGEAFKQMLIDPHIKVKLESGPWLKFFDREINIVKAFLSILKPEWKQEISQIVIRPEITPYSVREDKNLAEILDVLVRTKILSREAAANIMNYAPNVKADMEKISQEKELVEYS
jgi:hypothetical protein